MGHRKLAEAKKYFRNCLQYTFTNTDYLEEALWAFPAVTNSGRHLPEGNKRLAMVGDAVLKLVTVEAKYDNGECREAMHRHSEALINNAYLSSLGEAKNIEQYVQLNPGMFAISNYMRATAVEACLGAVWKDSGADHAAVKHAAAALGILT